MSAGAVCKLRGFTRTTSLSATALAYPIQCSTTKIAIHTVMLVTKMVPKVCIVLTPQRGFPQSVRPGVMDMTVPAQPKWVCEVGHNVHKGDRSGFGRGNFSPAGANPIARPDRTTKMI